MATLYSRFCSYNQEDFEFLMWDFFSKITVMLRMSSLYTGFNRYRQ